MRLVEEGIRRLISAALVSYLVVVAIYLWFIDLLAKQQEFGLFLATELLAFGMLLYVSTKPGYHEINKSWLLAGCIFTAFCLAVALLT
jgi:hypothetical protein